MLESSFEDSSFTCKFVHARYLLPNEGYEYDEITYGKCIINVFYKILQVLLAKL